MQTILMVRFSYLLFLIGITLILSLTFCNRDKQLAVPEHPMLTLAEFNQLSRIEQVKMCGSCHPKQYESEMKGPHANAYKMLEAHFNYIGSEEKQLGVIAQELEEIFPSSKQSTSSRHWYSMRASGCGWVCECVGGCVCVCVSVWVGVCV